jgi:superfamily II DNA helicase RecQ
LLNIILNNWTKETNNKDQLANVNKIVDYCLDRAVCRKKYILNYLGEKFEESKCEKMCDNCRNISTVDEINLSQEALDFLFRFRETLGSKMFMTKV